MFVDKKFWKKTLLDSKTNIKDAIKSLANSSLQIVMINDEKGLFLGTVTDGDIRRALLKGLSFETNILKITKLNPYILDNSINAQRAEDFCKQKQIINAPVINKKKIVVGLFNLIEKNKSKQKNINNYVVIMAGGKGTRLGKLTKMSPKPMLKFRGKILLEHIIDSLKILQLKNIYISVFYKKKIIKKYFAGGSKFGVNINYIEEKKPLGPIGSLKLINTKDINNKDFFVINCDTLTSFNYLDLLTFHKKNNCMVTIVIKKVDTQNQYGVIKVKNNHFVDFTEKPRTILNINTGIYLFSPKIISIMRRNKFFSINELLHHLKQNQKKIMTYPMFEEWYDLGNKKKLLKI
jgi:dTDP-glucose pyrophosphorylase